MGYLLNRLGNLPDDDTVKYYLFLLRESFNTPLLETIDRNFGEIAKAIGDDAIYAVGLNQQEWLHEVASTYLGENWPEYLPLLPALLITDKHPDEVDANSLRLFMPLHDVDKRFGNMDQFLGQVTRFVRGENNKFLESFRKKGDVFDETRKIFKFELGVAGFKIDLGELISQMRVERKDTKTPLAY
jgi:hypothetical protein